jgi:hypothetical protein
LCLLAYSGVQHIWCYVFVLFFLVLCTLCGSFSGLSIFDSTLWDLFTTKLTNSVDFKPCLTVVLWYSYQHRYYSLQHLLFLFQNLLDLKKIITDNFIYSRVRVMVFNTTFNNISAIYWRSVLLDEETGVRWENHIPDTSIFIYSNSIEI